MRCEAQAEEGASSINQVVSKYCSRRAAPSAYRAHHPYRQVPTRLWRSACGTTSCFAPIGLRRTADCWLGCLGRPRGPSPDSRLFSPSFVHSSRIPCSERSLSESKRMARRKQRIRTLRSSLEKSEAAYYLYVPLELELGTCSIARPIPGSTRIAGCAGAVPRGTFRVAGNLLRTSQEIRSHAVCAGQLLDLPDHWLCCGVSVAMRTTLDGASALPTLAPVPAPLSRTWTPCCSYWGLGMNLGLSIFSKDLLRAQTQAPCHACTDEYRKPVERPQGPCPWAPPRPVRLFLHSTSSRLSLHPCERWDPKLLWVWRPPSTWSCCSGPLWDL